jgi:hypothetical protein
MAISHGRVTRRTGHAGKSDSWSSLAAGIVTDRRRWHFFPVAVEEWPLVLGLVGERSNSTVCPVQLGETFGRIDLSSCLRDGYGLIEVSLLDPVTQHLIILLAALAEYLMDISQGKEIDVAVHVLGQNHKWRIVGWSVNYGSSRSHDADGG